MSRTGPRSSTSSSLIIIIIIIIIGNSRKPKIALRLKEKHTMPIIIPINGIQALKKKKKKNTNENQQTFFYTKDDKNTLRQNHAHISFLLHSQLLTSEAGQDLLRHCCSVSTWSLSPFLTGRMFVRRTYFGHFDEL